MTSTWTNRLHAALSRLSTVDWIALGILLLEGVLEFLRQFFARIPESGFLTFLSVCASIYWLVRLWNWARYHLLWSLRNRLITAYIFIAVVPVLLLLTMAGLAAYLLYWQLGSYVIYTQMEEREVRAGVVAAAVATSQAVEAQSGRSAAALALPVDRETYIRNAMTELPGLKIDTGGGEELLAAKGVFGGNRFRGLVLSHGQLAMRAVVARPAPSGRIVVSVTVPVSPELIDTLAPELGPITFNVLRPQAAGAQSEVPAVINREEFMSLEQIGTRGRPVPPAVNVFDKLINGIVGLEVVDLDKKEGQSGNARVFVSFSTRPSLLNRRLFSPLGDLGGVAATALLVVGVIFLVIEIGSLITGIIMTRTITSAVNNLYQATQHVQAGDLSFRVRIPHRDQLAALGESFNSMMQSVSTLIEEQRKRQRLENEISIAREVQQQLYPRSLPNLPGIEIDAFCRPAREVSGDYYDFIRISPTRLAIALADISGKGISAALLMANVQAALRSDVLRYRDGQPETHPVDIDTAQIVSHLNRHLFRNTSSERYATCFFGVFDTETRRLHYTNAGHLPPIYVCGRHTKLLETGGMVVGLFDDVPFDQGVIEIQQGGFLIAYSDGLIEAENVYGEEFGAVRLVDVAAQNKDTSPHAITQAVVRAAEEWSGTPEQADDVTIIVMRSTAVAQERSA